MQGEMEAAAKEKPGAEMLPLKTCNLVSVFSQRSDGASSSEPLSLEIVQYSL